MDKISHNRAPPSAGPHRPLANWQPQPYPVPPELAGTATVAPDGAVEAGSWQSFTLIYTAGRFGIDDSGSIKICFRFASDQTRPQLDDPTGPGFVTVEASNSAVLEPRFDYKQNTRPWDRTLYIKVVRGFMREGDTITVRFGDRRRGSPGMRTQTFAEPFFEFHVLADPIACYHFVPVAQQPLIAIEAGPRCGWIAVLPSIVGRPETFSLRMRSEDQWGNPSGKGAVELILSASAPVEGLPAALSLAEGQATAVIEGLRPTLDGDLLIELRARGSGRLAVSNVMRVVPEIPRSRLYWADFHAQSGETIGTNAAEDYFAFARDTAFIDIVGHQGNDFQITPEFWSELDRLYQRFDEPGRFVTTPGYEWSGNTALGGDRNVFFAASGRPIRRSSHALVADHADLATDCHTANALFAALKRDGEDAITFAHVGGRYADIAVAHDIAIETAVEVHSSWGTFEWIVNDAFDLGYRVGIVANSDGHKGRPGAEGPGASLFGAYGGLTCLQLPELSRRAVFEALRARRHYATTGARVLLDVAVSFAGEAQLFAADPALGPSAHQAVVRAAMGSIVYAAADTATLAIAVSAAAPIERIEIRNGREIVAVHRPYHVDQLGRRIRVIWSGAEYRGRFRMTAWDGGAALDGNAFEHVAAVNFFNPDRPLQRDSEHALSWRSITTGNFSGFDATLRDASAGRLALETPLGKLDIPVTEIGYQPLSFSYGGLDRKLTVYRLPDVNPCLSVTIEQVISLRSDHDNPLYVSVVTEDGHQAWSSPIYAIARPDWL
ncbi:DUF3604 domain-containing protein [Bradyrhizobium sp.]|uniref:DUF3604 domain-containing protein n=1 Tax=Bradyrhizobium sp. TaxID=376 RepID=UPI003C40675F